MLLLALNPLGYSMYISWSTSQCRKSVLHIYLPQLPCFTCCKSSENSNSCDLGNFINVSYSPVHTPAKIYTPLVAPCTFQSNHPVESSLCRPICKKWISHHLAWAPKSQVWFCFKAEISSCIASLLFTSYAFLKVDGSLTLFFYNCCISILWIWLSFSCWSLKLCYLFIDAFYLA